MAALGIHCIVLLWEHCGAPCIPGLSLSGGSSSGLDDAPSVLLLYFAAIMAAGILQENIETLHVTFHLSQVHALRPHPLHTCH